MKLKITKRRKRNKWGPPYTLKQKGTALAAALSLITVAVAPGLVGASGANTVSNEDEGIATVNADVPRSVTFDLDELAPTGEPWSTYPTWNTKAGHLVYYGSYEGSGIRSKVLSTYNTQGSIVDGTTQIVDPSVWVVAYDIVYDRITVSDTSTNPIWGTGKIYNYLNSGEHLDSYTQVEYDALNETTVNASTADYRPSRWISDGVVTYSRYFRDINATSKFFLMSARELLRSYEEVTDLIAIEGTDLFGEIPRWIRTGLTTSSGSIYGQVLINTNQQWIGYNATSSSPQWYIEPSFNIGVDNIAYASLSNQSKTSDGMTATSTEVGVEGETDEARATRTWDLTLKGGTAMTAEITDEKLQYNPGAVINLEVGSLGTPDTDVEYTQLTGMLIDSNDRVVYTGRIGSAISNQILKVQVPSSTPAGNYTFKVFAEDVNGATYTDYASEPAEFDIQVGYQVDIVNTAVDTKLIRNTSNGVESQFTGFAINPVVYTVDQNYYFFESNYTGVGMTGQTINGITIHWNSYGQITLSGTPTADTVITMSRATDKLDQEPPEGLQDQMHNKIWGLEIGMEYSTSMYGPWTVVTSDTEYLEGGTYYVRNCSTDVYKASDAVGPYEVYTYYSVYVENDPTVTYIDLSNGASYDQEVTSTQAMDTIIYTAKEGYYFPTTYYVSAGYGVTVTRNSSSQITVAGTPTNDVYIDLIAATKTGEQAAPRVTGGIEKITGTDASMEYASSADATDWTPCTIFTTEVAEGTWYVRYMAYGNLAASAATKVVVTGPLDVEIIIPDNAFLYHVDGSGDMTQEDIVGTMIAASFRADDGCYFPENYAKNVSITPDNSGISVTWDNSGQITVAGTPTANTRVTLTTALTLNSQSAPEVNGGTGVITGTDTLMVYATSEDATTWYPCTDDMTNVIGGIYYVKYAARTGYAESPTTMVIVENTPRTIKFVNSDDTNVKLYSGSPEQTVSGYMQDVVYRTTGGYIFPEDYSVSVGNGVTMTRDSENQITFSGAPVIDMEIEIIPADFFKEVTGYTVTVDGTKATTISRDTDSGDYLQTPDFGDGIVEIIYVAEENYYFPESYFYANAGTNGITISRVEGVENKISIQGTPTADVNITLGDATVIPLTEVYSVWVKTELPAGFTRVDGTGTVYQTAIIKGSAMTDIIYTANTGYYFPQSYANDYSVEGVKVTRVDESTIKVSGTPEANVELTLPAASIILTGYNVSIINPSGSGITKVTGDDYQSGVLGAMDEVVYQADYGYEFPSNYSVSDKNGVTVERLNESFIKVSGTPDNDVTITLTEANKMSSEDIPELDEDATSVTIYKSASSNMTRVSGTGYEIQYNVQNNVNEEMVAVEYTADENYYFPENYTVSTSTDSGISVSWLDSTTIRVSGVPSGAITVMLTSATWCGDGEEPDKSGKTVDIINAASTNLKKLSGDESQSGVVGTMEEVIYEVKDGYYLPENYYVSPINGVRVYRLNDTQLMVIGTPTADTTVILAAASKSEVADTPQEIYYEVSVINPSESGIEWCSGSQNQFISGAMTDVVFVAGDDYYFDTDYAVESVGGIEVRRINEKTIIVTGTPTTDAYITLQPATLGDWDVPTPDPDVTYTVTVNEASNLVLASGTTPQSVVATVAMKDVVYTVADGYYFPSDYADGVTSDNGVSVRYINSTMIVVEGTPTADATITLVAPTESEDTPVTPPVEDTWNVVVNGATGLELASGLEDQDVAQGSKMTVVVYTAADGYYFPSTYADTITAVKGVSVRYVNSKMIVVEGTPEGDVEITLVEADIEEGDVVTPSPDPVDTYRVEVKKANNLVLVSGEEVQNVEEETLMKEVVYTVASGYYFPEDYADNIASVKGISVRYVNSTTIVVYGVPEGDAEITLNEPSIVVVDPDAPVEPDATFSVTVNGTEKLVLVSGTSPQSVVQGNAMTDVVYTVADGYYFPSEYADNFAEVKGISVSYVNTMTIIVSGIPEGDVVINLVKPDEIPETPTEPDVEKPDVDSEEGVSVVVIEPDNSGFERVTGTGSATQTGIEGAMKEVIFIADVEYYFPAYYGVAPVNDVEVTRLSENTISVSGTPSATTVIELIPATRRDDPENPYPGFDDDDDANDGQGDGEGDGEGDDEDEEVYPEGVIPDSADPFPTPDNPEPEPEMPNDTPAIEDLEEEDVDGDGIPDINIDVDGDGIPDINLDINGDKVADINIDIDGDNIPELNIDTDGNMLADVNVDVTGDMKPNINIDTDNTGVWKTSSLTTTRSISGSGGGDGIWKPDTNIDTSGNGKSLVAYFTVAVDADGNGVDDRWIPNRLADYTGNGIADYDTSFGYGLNIDLDGDGVADLNVDLDGDGEADTNIDTTGDRQPNLNIDLDGDGIPDLNVDIDGDGEADLNIDTDGDGIPDLNVDADGDGIPDENVDTNNDGDADTNITNPSDSNWTPSAGVQTGDDTSVLVYIFGGLASLSALVLTLLKRRKTYR